MKNGIVISLLCLLSFAAAAQEDKDKIETDRPDQTETPALVPHRFFQAELGWMKENTGADYDLYMPTALLKYGLLKKLELRLEGTVLRQYQQLIPNPKTITGLKPLELGTKLALLDEKGITPKTSLIAHVGLPFLASKNFRTAHLVPSFRFAMQNNLSSKIKLGYNLGAEWEETTAPATYLYTLAPGIDLGEKWYAYIEVYGFIQKNEKPKHNLDAGFAYFINTNMQADLSGGIGLSKASFDDFIAVGFSFRLPTSKQKPVQ